MPDKQPQFWEMVAVWASSLGIWATGESGRLYVAGAAGGFTRAIVSRTRRIMEWIAATGGGALAAYYLWPIAFRFLDFVMPGDLSEAPDNQRMAAFVAGLAGVSLIKLLIALFDGWSANLLEKGNGD